MWFAKELKLGIDFSRDILREDKVSIKRARTEEAVKTEDEVINGSTVGTNSNR